MSKLKQVARKVAEKLPFAITKNLAYDRQTVQVMRKVLGPESCCVDVGCHKGEVLEYMLRMSPKGEHHGFEPIPSFFTELGTKFPSNCHFYNLALSDSEGEVTFNYVVSNPAYSGIKQRSYAREDETIEKITVKTERLDKVLNGQRVDFIKIDVEGAELQVLKGATGILNEQKPTVIFEHGLGAADHYGTRPEQVFDLLAGSGLAVSTMKRWLTNKEPMQRAEFVSAFDLAKDYYFMAYAMG